MLSLESIMEGRSSVKTQRPFQNLEEKASELAELEHCRARLDDLPPLMTSPH